MKVLILAGGFGTRLSEETDFKPKPMVEIGGRPILWHIMKIYSHYGFNDFVVLLGYKGYYIKEYFVNYFLHQNDVTIDIQNNKLEYFNNKSEPWKITLLDTGIETMTGGRIKRAQKVVGNETFMLTYGDGVSDVDINKLLEFHYEHKKSVTLTAVKPTPRFGGLRFNGDLVSNFSEKPQAGEGWINGGFFVCEPEVFDYISGDEIIWERQPLESLAANGKLVAYKHNGFWQCMDTLREKKRLIELWNSGKAPWKVWS